MDEKQAVVKVQFEVKIHEQYLIINSFETEMQICAGNLTLSPSEMGGVSAHTVGRAVLKLFAEVQKRRANQVLGLDHAIAKAPTQLATKLLTTFGNGAVLSIGDVALILRISEGSVRRLENRGFLRASRTPGGHRRYEVSEIARLIEKQNSKGGRIQEYCKVPVRE